MRIIRLELEAFGPFKDRMVIDFDSFNGLFLVSGETGSGKTTIFDAITYGLYGKMTGEFKDERCARCQYTDSDIPTEVILDFDAKGKKYRVVRGLPYRKKGNKNDTQGSCNLFEFDEESLLPIGDKRSVVDTKIKELIGFGFEQFKKVVVLPQGEFLKILNANTKDKEELLETFFDAEIYQKIQNKLKERYDLSYASVNTIEELKKMAEDSKEEYDIQKKEYENENDLLLKKEQTLKEIKENNDRIDLLSIKERELSTLKESENQVEYDRKFLKILKEAKELKPKYDSYNKALSSYNNALKEYDDLEKRKAELETKKKEIDTIPSRVNDLSSKIDELKKKIESKEKIKNSLSNVNLLNKEIDNLKSGIENKEKRLETLKKESSLYDAKIESLSNDQTNINNLIDNYDEEFERNVNALVELKKRHDDFLNEMKDIGEKIEKIKADLQNLHLKLKNEKDEETRLEYIESISKLGAFKHLIIEGKECPLCGSVHHPNVLESEVDFNPSDLKNIREKINDTNSLIAKSEEKISRFEKDIIDAKNSEVGLLDPRVFDGLEEKVTKKDKLLNELKKNKNDLKIIRENLDELRKEKKKKEEEINSIDLIADRAVISQKEGMRDKYLEDANELKKSLNVSEIEKDLNLDLKIIEKERDELESKEKAFNRNYILTNASFDNSKKTLEASIKALNDSKDDYETYVKENGIVPEEYVSNFENIFKIDELQEKISKYDNDSLKLTAEIETIRKMIKGDAVKEDVGPLEENIDESRKSVDELKVKVEDLLLKMNGFRKSEIEYENLLKENSEILKKHSVIEELYNAVSGNLKGQKKVSLKRYILMKLFDHVVEFANHYLLRFTDTRYHLRRVESESGSDRGLDLEVFDSLTSSYRSVSNISGGESFMASLALALGMSEYISNVEGGIRIENVFIDEGFGTLDSQTVDQAINSLIELTETGRLIGIISHVDQVKGQIHSGINVIKGRNGSTIEVIE